MCLRKDWKGGIETIYMIEFRHIKFLRSVNRILEKFTAARPEKGNLLLQIQIPDDAQPLPGQARVNLLHLRQALGDEVGITSCGYDI